MVFGRNFDASSSFTGMVLSHLANVILEVRRFCEQNLFHAVVSEVALGTFWAQF
jgi:hypothetical protein